MCELILVVDDEPIVRNVVSAILRNAGYEVLEASSADEAMEVGRKRSGAIHLLLSDVLMPGGSGPALAEQFASLHPETKQIFMAGLPDSPEICEKIVSRGLPFLAKPFLAQDLINAVPPRAGTLGQARRNLVRPLCAGSRSLRSSR